MPTALIAIFIFLCALPAMAQRDYGPWTFEECTRVEARWQKCYITTPRFMGPNALPVPPLKKGFVKEKAELEILSENHFSPGDQTYGLNFRIYLPLLPRWVAVEAYGVALEYFKVSQPQAEQRAIVPWNYQAQGTSVGDLYLGTIVQVLRHEKRKINLALSFNLKTASGSNLENARFTDSPGYFLDASLGKTYAWKGSIFSQLRLSGMLGFYAWQTYSDSFPQDDAGVYGFGLDLMGGNFQIQQAIRGYVGYLQGDSPLLYQLDLLWTRPKLDYRLGYQRGNRDFPFHTLRFSLIYRFAFNLTGKKG